MDKQEALHKVRCLLDSQNSYEHTDSQFAIIASLFEWLVENHLGRLDLEAQVAGLLIDVAKLKAPLKTPPKHLTYPRQLISIARDLVVVQHRINANQPCTKADLNIKERDRLLGELCYSNWVFNNW